ncbi:MAG: N-acetyltransferase GCN5 [Rhizobiaceae bacterium MnEN-MB40S]|nr:MAG: N-acetyltransferase GCN5 [Rhizobiaceae bacterium MnEN-MB40S]
MQTAAITRMTVDDFEKHIDDFAAVLHACVHAGANVNFVLPFSLDDSAAFWTNKVAPALENGKRVIWAAMENGRVAGTVQLDYDTPPNQPHRAEVTKLLVHPDFRRRGIAKALMAELESEAQRLGRSLITLDTRTGDKAEPLYASMGYQTVGIIPDFCVDPIESRLHPTTIMYKAL